LISYKPYAIIKTERAKMSRTNLPPTNKKSIQCPDCGKWLTLQGYGGHRRFYHGEYQKDLKRQLFDRLIALRKANKISQSVLEATAPILGGYSNSTMEEILEVRDFINSIP
jgi:hypothetical protein